jgi:hypothetical protein
LQADKTRKINLISSDGDVFEEVDYGLALMSKRFEEITVTVSVGRANAIYVPKVSGKMLKMVIDYYNKHKLDYCRKHKPTHQSKLLDWDAEFVNVDLKTLFDLATTACYMKIVSLEELARSKLCKLIKGKKPEEIAMIFGAADD